MSASNWQNINQKNLASIKRIDPFAEHIVAHATHAAVYDFSLKNKQWEKTEYDGPMFVYKRCDRPYCSFIIANRQSLTDFIEPVTINLKFKLEQQYIFIHRPNGEITGLWFSSNDECKKIYDLLNRIIAASGNVPDSLITKSPTPSIASATKTVSSPKASASNENDTNHGPSSSCVLSKAAVSEIKLTKDASHVNDKDRPFETTDSINISSLSKDKPVPKESYDNGLSNDLSSIEISDTNARNNIVVGLTKEQLLMAIEHLIKTDDDFMNKIHQAYLDSLANKLRR